MEATSESDLWELAAAVAAALRGSQPEDGCSHLDSVDVVAFGRAAVPAIEMRWHQQRRNGTSAAYGLIATMSLLVDSQDYEEWLDPPDRPRTEELLGLLRLAVYEPHEHPHPAAHRLWFDYLP